MGNKNDDTSLFGKVSNLFGSSKEEKQGDKVLDAKVDQEGVFEGLKNRIFGTKREVEIIDIEAFEEVTADMELVIVEQELNESGEVVEKQELVSMESLEAGEGILDTLSGTMNSALDTIKNTASSSWDFTANKFGNAKRATVEFSSSTADSLVQVSKQVGEKYDKMEITPKFYSFINAIDLVVVITGLQVLLDKQKKGSKEFIALSVVLGVLLLLDRSKEEMKKEMGFIEINDELNQDLSALLKSVTFKDVVETAEPILLIIPNGNYILLILKLFV
ncbi:hypothetical protein [Myroides marinus]|uniref:hypothetical protein n=1 Tax=Myroides marinus TaxID=703342 RepID=UPI002574A9BD|nr:hypothetical protein [Myroides marinus]MDM1346499.1 hypothetical protein [Myroides marinus]MDM1349918.1 hypothetical protein [Myroides marinus]MDM1357126.1 hypothetical protein [Myroides marinus]